MLHRHCLIVIVVAALSSSVQADVLFVDDDNCPGPGDGSELDPYCSIQTAIDNAVDTDEIVVAPGTYFETIDFLGKAITVRSTDPLDLIVVTNTVIDGTGNLHGVQCVTGEESDTVLDGFTITGGNANGPCCGADSRGGGMYIDGSSPTVTNCTFIGNIAHNVGGGMYSSFSNSTVTNCTFIDNSADGGGGMCNGNTSSSTVTNCTFIGNIGYNVGGGIFNGVISSSTVTNCTFSGNTGNRGGGMCNGNTSSSTVTNCTFIGNTAATFGGGMFNLDTSSSTVTNCTFSRNTATYSGGGMYIDSGTVTNCILWGNSPDEIGLGGPPAVAYTDVQGGFPGTGNIDADPHFVGGPSGTWTDPGVFNPAAGVTTFTDTNASFEPGGLVGGFLAPLLFFPAELPIVANTATTISVAADVSFLGVPGLDYEVNDYRLTATSPCIDAGDNTAVPVNITTDLDGNPRFLDVPETPDTGNGTLPVVDMGAYESLGGGCLAVTSQEVVCHADGTTFTVNIEGLNACTGGSTQVTFTASGGAVGEELCFTALVNDGGFCCTTEICVTIPDCTPASLPSDLDGDGLVGIEDFLALLAAWGSCSDCGTCPADFDGDCSVGILDLLILLAHWG